MSLKPVYTLQKRKMRYKNGFNGKFNKLKMIFLKNK